MGRGPPRDRRGAAGRLAGPPQGRRSGPRPTGWPTWRSAGPRPPCPPGSTRPSTARPWPRPWPAGADGPTPPTQYRRAIDLADDDPTRRRWWLNLAEVAQRLERRPDPGPGHRGGQGPRLDRRDHPAGPQVPAGPTPASASPGRPPLTRPTGPIDRDRPPEPIRGAKRWRPSRSPQSARPRRAARRPRCWPWSASAWDDPGRRGLGDRRARRRSGLLGLLFWQNIRHFVLVWSTDENYSHGFLVPLISLYFANEAARQGPGRRSARASGSGSALIAPGPGDQAGDDRDPVPGRQRLRPAAGPGRDLRPAGRDRRP